MEAVRVDDEMIDEDHNMEAVDWGVAMGVD